MSDSLRDATAAQAVTATSLVLLSCFPVHPKDRQGQEGDATSSAEGSSPCRAAHRPSDTSQNQTQDPFCCGLPAVPGGTLPAQCLGTKMDNGVTAHHGDMSRAEGGSV